jgi:hypothetical protein
LPEPGNDLPFRSNAGRVAAQLGWCDSRKPAAAVQRPAHPGRGPADVRKATPSSFFLIHQDLGKRLHVSHNESLPFQAQVQRSRLLRNQQDVVQASLNDLRTMRSTVCTEVGFGMTGPAVATAALLCRSATLGLSAFALAASSFGSTSFCRESSSFFVVAMHSRQGLSQRQLSEAVGREQTFIAGIETGQRRVDLVEFVIVCRACGDDSNAETARLVKKIGEMLPRRRKNTRYFRRIVQKLGW